MPKILSQANRLLSVWTGFFLRMSTGIFSGVRQSRWLNLQPPQKYQPIAPPATAHTRQPDLNQLCHWCTIGRLDQALLELHHWLRQDPCPPQAALLLTATLARQGQSQAALDILANLEPTLFQAEPALEQLRLVILIHTQQAAPAATSAAALAQYLGHEKADGDWLVGFKFYEKAEATAHDNPISAQLAEQLLNQHEVIPSLVAAALLRPADASTHLLVQALHRVSKDISPQHMLKLCLALAQLAMHVGEHDQARRSAHRGLQLDPYNATLAIMLSKVNHSPTLAIDTPAILKRAVDEHPDYHDLQAALIRTEHAQGQHDQAQLHLSHWLERHPAHPLAQKVTLELAA